MIRENKLKLLVKCNLLYNRYMIDIALSLIHANCDRNQVVGLAKLLDRYENIYKRVCDLSCGIACGDCENCITDITYFSMKETVEKYSMPLDIEVFTMAQKAVSSLNPPVGKLDEIFAKLTEVSYEILCLNEEMYRYIKILDEEFNTAAATNLPRSFLESAIRLVCLYNTKLESILKYDVDKDNPKCDDIVKFVYYLMGEMDYYYENNLVNVLGKSVIDLNKDKTALIKAVRDVFHIRKNLCYKHGLLPTTIDMVLRLLINY